MSVPGKSGIAAALALLGALACTSAAAEGAASYVFGGAAGASTSHSVNLLDFRKVQVGPILDGVGSDAVLSGGFAELQLDFADVVARLHAPVDGGEAVTLGLAYGTRLSPQVRLRVGPVLGLTTMGQRGERLPESANALAGLEVRLAVDDVLSLSGAAGTSQPVASPFGGDARYFTGLSFGLNF